MTGLPTDFPAPSSFGELSNHLGLELASWHGEPWAEQKFARLALQIFAAQFEGCAPYRRYCSARGIAPESVDHWQRIPPVPTEAFRHVEFQVASTGRELRFRTSGTTRGAGARGVHVVPEPELYRASLRSAFQQLVLKRVEKELNRSRRSPATSVHPLLVSLVPSFDPADGSSLAWMLDDLVGSFGRPGSRSVASASGVDWEALSRLCDAAAGGEHAPPDLAGAPVLLLGTTLAFDAWLRRLGRTGRSWELPFGSLLMDTGGVKGREGLDRDAMLRELLPRLGLEPSEVVNEFGMTELLSQRYGWGTGRPSLAGPPWLRTLVVDSVSLEPVPDGSEGILCHFDLANAGSVVAVLTEDRGVRDGGGIKLLGRTPGAPPRGCSLATSDLLRATEAE
jgi:hypothetical protein